MLHGSTRNVTLQKHTFMLIDELLMFHGSTRNVPSLDHIESLEHLASTGSPQIMQARARHTSCKHDRYVVSAPRGLQVCGAQQDRHLEQRLLSKFSRGVTMRLFVSSFRECIACYARTQLYMQLSM